jgi:decaprenylphospho-beta-D-ribofuranose 2-oxidase
MRITNWGNYPEVDSEILISNSITEISSYVESVNQFIPRGLGRCYGDSALNNHIFSTLSLNRFLSFDEGNGILECEAGVTLEEILNFFVPRGWFLPVTPGTKFITVGGAIASDIHGKNHHKSGSFSSHLLSVKILTGNGSIIACSNDVHADLFKATCGGMGLTGIIISATFKLIKIESSFIMLKQVKADNLNEIIDLLKFHEETTYTVAWIDCLKRGNHMGRSILMLGEHAKIEELTAIQRNNPLKIPDKTKLNVPFYFPDFALNNFSVKLFNFFYYNKQIKKISHSIIDYDSFFYPLDSIHNWNKIYGKRGFTQYQFVLPINNGFEGLKKILNEITLSGEGSFLAVLKLFGKQNNYLSFPMEGYTLALDFPIKNSVFKLFEKLDRIVIGYGGRLYLTKDCRMSREMFNKTYPLAAEFIKVKKKYDPMNKFQSLQSKRIGL